MLPFLNATNEIFAQMEIALPLPGQATTTMNDRLEKGAEAQAKIFGEHMKGAWKKGHINRWLAANCFGDFYTRTGLDLPQREMITFCFLMAQGGCEPQLIAHAKGNMNLGNDKFPCPGGIPVPALHRLSPQSERCKRFRQVLKYKWRNDYEQDHSEQ